MEDRLEIHPHASSLEGDTEEKENNEEEDEAVES
jgi:hypothetical protein